MSDDQPKDESEDLTPEINPFVSPKSSESRTDDERRRQRTMLVVAGVFLVPLSAGISGFCCCWAGVLTTGAFTGPSEYGVAIIAAIIGFGLGAFGAGWLVIHDLRKRWRKL